MVLVGGAIERTGRRRRVNAPGQQGGISLALGGGAARTLAHVGVLRLPCAIVAADLTAQTRRVFRTGRVIPAIEASRAIPDFFRPVEIDGHFYIDGGVVEPLPIHTLIDLTIDRPGPIVAVNVLGRAPRQAAPRPIWQLVGQITRLVQDEVGWQGSLR